MSERFSSPSHHENKVQPEDKTTEMPVAFTVSSGRGNFFGTQNAEGKNTGGLIVRKDMSEHAALEDDFIHEDDVEGTLSTLEVSDAEKDRVRREVALGKEALHIVMNIGESRNGKSQLFSSSVMADGERIGGGGQMFKQEQESNLRTGIYVPAAAIESLTAIMAVRAEGSAPDETTVGADRSLSREQSRMIQGKTYEQVARQKDQEREKRRKRLFAGLGAVALIGATLTASLFGGGGVKEVHAAPENSSSVSIEVDYPADVLSGQTDEQQSDASSGSIEQGVAVDASQYEYPWSWGAEQFGEANASVMLHELGAKAQADGHEVSWYTTDQGDNIIQVDGADDTASVITVLEQYR